MQRVKGAAIKMSSKQRVNFMLLSFNRRQYDQKSSVFDIVRILKKNYEFESYYHSKKN